MYSIGKICMTTIVSFHPLLLLIARLRIQVDIADNRTIWCLECIGIFLELNTALNHFAISLDLYMYIQVLVKNEESTNINHHCCLYA